MLPCHTADFNHISVLYKKNAWYFKPYDRRRPERTTQWLVHGRWARSSLVCVGQRKKLLAGIASPTTHRFNLVSRQIAESPLALEVLCDLAGRLAAAGSGQTQTSFFDLTEREHP